MAKVESTAPVAEETVETIESTAPVMMRVFIPKDHANKKEADKFVGVNGKNYLIKRGEYVDVPPEVAEVILLANMNAEIAEKYIDGNSI